LPTRACSHSLAAMKARKRSKSVRLILIGGVSATALAGCSPTGKAPISAQAFYTNDYFVPGVGYYHAPFGAFYPYPYNHYDAASQRYYYGGQWGLLPYLSEVNISSPPPNVASQAEALRTDVPRGGFGGTGGHFSTWG
jgi:hypothetical protein